MIKDLFLTTIALELVALSMVVMLVDKAYDKYVVETGKDGK